MLTDTIKSRNFPKHAGVYIFKDASGQVLYVGKANNLQNRINSYFRSIETLQIERPWIAVMVTEAASIETITVKTETEALLLESTLIKQFVPKFNIRLTDDKAYPYIKVFPNETIPRLSVSRKRSKDKAKYIGPFLNGRIANNLIELARIFYGIHYSNTQIKQSGRACIHCQMYGFECPLKTAAPDYIARFNEAIKFFDGDYKNFKPLLKQKMELAAKNNQFELAAKIRDQLADISGSQTEQSVITSGFDNFDVITVLSAGETAIVGLNTVLEGRLSYRENFFYSAQGIDSTEVINRFLIDFYRFKTPMPKQVLINVQPNKEVLKLVGDNTEIEFKTPQKGEKFALFNLCLSDTQNQLEIYLLKQNSEVKALINLKEILNLDFLPQTIEAVDISNLGASEPVGAIVNFKDGKPDKNNYRKFNIKTVMGQNDFAMIGEVVSRRFNDTTRSVPDIFMVDGGPVQLDFAQKALKLTKTQPKVLISLAKKPDRVYLTGKKRPLAISKNALGLRLLSKIRDEVHRFGISFHRNRQSKKSLLA